jgi:hypothetical protein
MIEDIPVAWSGIIGDIIHNLRSALDSLATNLVVHGGHFSKSALKETYFPIRSSKSLLSDKDASAFFRRVGPRVEKIIRRLQPYRGGKGHPLWQLNQLDIIDKHRRIIAAYGDLKSIQVNHWPQPTLPAAPLPFNFAPFPLKEGDELLRVAFWEPHFDSNAPIFSLTYRSTKRKLSRAILLRKRSVISSISWSVSSSLSRHASLRRASRNFAFSPEKPGGAIVVARLDLQASRFRPVGVRREQVVHRRPDAV